MKKKIYKDLNFLNTKKDIRTLYEVNDRLKKITNDKNARYFNVTKLLQKSIYSPAFPLGIHINLQIAIPTKSFLDLFSYTSGGLSIEQMFSLNYNINDFSISYFEKQLHTFLDDIKIKLILDSDDIVSHLEKLNSMIVEYHSFLLDIVLYIICNCNINFSYRDKKDKNITVDTSTIKNINNTIIKFLYNILYVEIDYIKNIELTHKHILKEINTYINDINLVMDINIDEKLKFKKSQNSLLTGNKLIPKIFFNIDKVDSMGYNIDNDIEKFKNSINFTVEKLEDLNIDNLEMKVEYII